MCEGDSAVVKPLTWPVLARCQDGQIFLDNTYNGITFNQREQGTFVISDPNVYKLQGNSLDNVTEE